MIIIIIYNRNTDSSCKENRSLLSPININIMPQIGKILLLFNLANPAKLQIILACYVQSFCVTINSEYLMAWPLHLMYSCQGVARDPLSLYCQCWLCVLGNNTKDWNLQSMNENII